MASFKQWLEGEEGYAPLEATPQEVSHVQGGWELLHSMLPYYGNDMNQAVAAYAIHQAEHDPVGTARDIGMMLVLAPHWKILTANVNRDKVIALIKQQGGGALVNGILKAYATYEPRDFTMKTIQDKHGSQ